jgi:hypothetical protein
MSDSTPLTRILALQEVWLAEDCEVRLLAEHGQLHNQQDAGVHILQQQYDIFMCSRIF